MKGVIHEALKSGGGIGETKEHHSGFKESLMDDEGRFPLMPVFDSDIIVSPSDVEPGEDFCPLEFVDEVRNEGKRVCVTDGVFVDIAIVLTGSEATVLLFDKEERGRLWGVRGANFACLYIFVKEVLRRFLFLGREGVYLADLRFERFVKVDLMVIGMGRRNMVCGFL